MDEYLASRSYREASLRQRRSIIGRFLEAMPVPVEDVQPSHVLWWWGQTADLAPATRRAYLQAVRGYLQWQVAVGRRDSDPSACIRTPTVHRKPPRTLTQGEVDLLRAAPMSRRERLIIGLMLDMGLRVGEVAQVAAEDLQDGRLTVHGKGGRDAVLPMPEHLVELMPAEGRVVDCTGSALSRRTKTLLRRAGLGHRSAHDLRRTAATLWAAQGVGPHVIAHLLRHSSLATSAHYVAVSEADTRDALGA